VSTLVGNGARTFSGNGITATVQAWANGAPNHGWAIVQDQSTKWTVRTSEDAQSGNRPRLRSHYQATVEHASPSSGNGVTVAIIDSGLLPDGGTSHPRQDHAGLHHGLVSPSGRVGA
jgi:hypothetical protein